MFACRLSFFTEAPKGHELIKNFVIESLSSVNESLFSRNWEFVFENGSLFFQKWSLFLQNWEFVFFFSKMEFVFSKVGVFPFSKKQTPIFENQLTPISEKTNSHFRNTNSQLQKSPILYKWMSHWGLRRLISLLTIEFRYT